MLNAISVDVEEYYHAANLEAAVGPARWHAMPSRVEQSTDRVLELFAEAGVQGTFFILGHSARRHPGLIRRIAAAGHEIASHGYAHRLAYRQQPRAFFRDVRRTKLLLEDLTGRPVLGYRAPNFSIRAENAWAYDALIAAGYIYDSSLYPVWHPRYENLRRSTTPEIVQRERGELFEFPLAALTLHVLGKELRVPLAGGAYWRHFPPALMARGLELINTRRGQWVTCYFHPWELDAGQPAVAALSPLTKIRHYGGIERFDKRLRQFLRRFSFGTIHQAARQTFGMRFDEAAARAGVRAPATDFQGRK